MKEYIIKEGKHYPKGLHFGLTFSNKISFRAMFDKSCLYHFGDIDDYDINKLCGFSTTWFHQKQSARVGWRVLDKNLIQIVTYSYNDGIRQNTETDVLGVVKPGEVFYCEIEDLENKYKYSFRKANSKSIETHTDVKIPDWFLFHYYLFPYFGGNKVAPHDMKLFLEIL